MARQRTPIRRWLFWTTAAVWIATLAALLIATHTHPATTARIAVSLREISFRTNARHILEPSDEEQLLISGVGSLQIRLNSPQPLSVGGVVIPASSVQIDGGPSSACSFYQVRSSGINLDGTSAITLGVPNPVGTTAFDLKAHGGALNGNLTSRPTTGDLKPGVECARVRTNQGPVGDVVVNLSPEGGDAIFFATSADTQMSFDLTANSEIGDTQVPILGQVRFSHNDPRTLDEKTVLLKGKNEVSFEKVGKNEILDEADLLVVDPKSDFYLTRFKVKDG